MGWTSYGATCYKNGRVDRLAECREEFGKQPTWATIVKDSLVGKVYYAAMRSAKTGEVWALIVLTRVEKGEFFYKDMDETMHPGYYDCPKSIFKLLSPTNNELAKEWRTHCFLAQLEKKEKNRLAKKLAEAKMIHVIIPKALECKIYEAGESVFLKKGRRGSWIDSAKRIRFRRKQVLMCKVSIVA